MIYNWNSHFRDGLGHYVQEQTRRRHHRVGNAHADVQQLSLWAAAEVIAALAVAHLYAFLSLDATSGSHVRAGSTVITKKKKGKKEKRRMPFIRIVDLYIYIICRTSR